jgi:zinc metalloprotease ZmpB
MSRSFLSVSLLLLSLTLVIPLFGLVPVTPSNFEISSTYEETIEYYPNMKFSTDYQTPRTVFGISETVEGNTPEDMSIEYLETNEILYNINIKDLVHSSTRDIKGRYIVRYQQVVGDIPVYQSRIAITINAQNKVVSVASSLRPGAETRLNSTFASLTSEQAENIAFVHLGITKQSPSQPTSLTIYDQRNTATLCYKVSLIPEYKVEGDWEFLIDANSGEILRAVDIACYYTGTGKTFAPDPGSRSGLQYGESGLVDDNDNDSNLLTSMMQPCSLPNLSYFNGNYYLSNDYAVFYDLHTPTFTYEQPSLTFEYSRSNATKRFEAVNIFHHINLSMQYLNETLGISSSPTLYTGGVRFDPAAGTENNAYYSPSEQALAFYNPPAHVDSGEDPECIWHELGHGIHDWLTEGIEGYDGQGGSQNTGLSEGCGDYWAASYTQSVTSFAPSDPEYFWFGHWALQPLDQPYLRVTNSTKHYPEDLTNECHADGEIWSSALMELRMQLGREVTDILFWSGIASTVGNSKQDDAALFVRQADMDLYYGNHLSVINDVFSRRGYYQTNDMPWNLFKQSVYPCPVISWTASQTPADHYTVYRNDTPVANITGTTYTDDFATMVYGAPYTYYVTAWHDGQESTRTRSCVVVPQYYPTDGFETGTFSSTWTVGSYNGIPDWIISTDKAFGGSHSALAALTGDTDHNFGRLLFHQNLQRPTILSFWAMTNIENSNMVWLAVEIPNCETQYFNPSDLAHWEYLSFNIPANCGVIEITAFSINAGNFWIDDVSFGGVQGTVDFGPDYTGLKSGFHVELWRDGECHLKTETNGYGNFQILRVEPAAYTMKCWIADPGASSQSARFANHTQTLSVSTLPVQYVDFEVNVITLSSIFVSATQPNATFTNLQEACDFLQLFSSACSWATPTSPFTATVTMVPGSYSHAWLQNIDNANLTIRGADKSTCFIDGVANPNDHFTGVYFNNACSHLNLTVRNLTIRNWHGHGIGEQQPVSPYTNSLTVDNCIIRDNTSDFGGAGICVSSKATITGNVFTNNIAQFDGHDNWGGAIYLMCQGGITSTIQNNVFQSNRADLGGALVVTGMSSTTYAGTVKVNNNRFLENGLTPTPYGNTSAIYCRYLNSFEFQGNIVANSLDCPYNNVHEIAFAAQCMASLVCKNNNFVNNAAVAASISSINSNASFDNNIVNGNTFSGSPLPTPFIWVGSTIANGHCTNNCIYGNSSNTLPTGINSDTMLFTNPLINSTTYEPLWTTTTRSPCIDAGRTDNDGDGAPWYNDTNECDADGSRRDIGAVPAPSHRNDAYTLNGGNGWHWLSVPGVDELYTGQTVNNINYIFDVYHDNNLLQTTPTNIMSSVNWQYNSPPQSASYSSQLGWQNTNAQVRSVYGYKLQFTGNGEDDYLMEYSGFQCGSNGNSNNLLHLDPPAAGQTYNEAWLGYYPTTVMDYRDALEAVVDQLVMIKTEQWCLVRHSTSDPWQSSSQSVRWAFEPGNCVVVQYVGAEAVDFRWGEGEPVTPKQIQEAKHFSYREEEDYTPIYVELDSTQTAIPANSELAVYADDVCYGAVVIDADTVQVNAYILDNPDIQLDDLEFRYWEPEQRGESIPEQPIANYQVMDPVTGRFAPKTIQAAENKRFYRVKLDLNDIGSGVPAVTALKGNYPNPFNPTTTISFSLAKEGNVRIDIYNIRGERVRTALNETRSPGGQSVVWNGTDDNQHSVASGVYFCRMTADGKTQTRKMLLLK